MPESARDPVPLPTDEAGRLAALERYGVLDTAPEPAYTDLARLAATICGTAAAAVSFVDGTRQWHKAVAGARAELLGSELPRIDAFCAHTVAAGTVLVIPDARADARFGDNPFVAGTPHLRFYAGAPIVSPDGHAVGTVCVLDLEPRDLTAEQREALAALGRQAARALELRQHVALLEQEVEVRALAEAAAVEAADALVQSEARLRRLADATLDGVVIYRAERIVEVNRRFCELYGVAEAEAIGRPVTDFVPVEAQAEVLRQHRESIEGKYRSLGRRTDGTVFPIEASARNFVWNGMQARLTVIHDITESMEIDRLKNEFISTVSHELRTPLTSIRGSLGLIEAGVVGEVSPRARELTRIARTNADRLIRLINDILDLEKMEAGRLEMRVVPLDPSDLVTTTLEDFQGMAEQRKVRLLTRLTRHDRLLGDRDRVVQVLTNLVSNAIKFSPENGEVVVHSAAGAMPRSIRFTVEDQGPGVPAEKREQLFRRFAQLDASDSRARGGTGLGLAISRTIVEQLGGRIGVESVPDVRTEFWFELPLVSTGRTPRPESAPDDAAHGDADAPHTVLVVEDDVDLADILSILLPHEGFEVVRAGTLAEADLALAQHAPSVLLLDIALPDGDGLHWAIARHARGALDLPVVVLSGHEPGDRADSAPVREWLTKPSDERWLFAALRRAVRPAGAPRALVVDADAEARHVRVAQLTSWGVECTEAGDGAAALAHVQQSPPDLIVLDPALPVMDGFDLVGRLRQSRARATPLLVHTSRQLGTAERKSLALGPTAHRIKSVGSEAELARTMRTLLEAFRLDDGS